MIPQFLDGILELDSVVVVLPACLFAILRTLEPLGVLLRINFP